MSFKFKKQRSASHDNRRTRRLAFEQLEDRHLLALLGVTPELPLSTYNSTGVISYDSGTDEFSLTATPIDFADAPGPMVTGLYDLFTSSVRIDIQVDDTGALTNGVAGFQLIGDLDTDFDFVADYSGVLLTGNVTQFGFLDFSAGEDLFDFRIDITGGELAGGDFAELMVGADIGFTTTSEGSNFANFNVNFTGGAKGEFGPIDEFQPNITPGIKLVKYVDDNVIDEEQVYIDFNLGDAVEFSYHVTNTSDSDDIELADIEIVDDNATPGNIGDDFSTASGDIVYVSGDTDNDGRLDVDEEWIFTATITATALGQFTNIAEATGTPLASGNPLGYDVTDDDSAYYQVIAPPGIAIEKLTNGQDADDPMGNDVPQIAPGQAVTWSYVVTNTGGVAFQAAEVIVTDDNGTPGNTGDDFSTLTGGITLVAASDVGGDGILSPGEVWTFQATATAASLSNVGATSTIHLTGNSALDGAEGNIRTFTADGVSVHASAFSRNTNGSWEKSFLGAYSGGLGVTDSSEGNGGDGLHRVDNVGKQNFVLFEFSEEVIVDRAFLDSVVDDSDVSVWIGTLTDPFNNHNTLSNTLLSSVGFNEVNNTGSSSSRWADINGGQRTGNVLVIAASVEDDTPEDRFKIHKIQLQTLLPGIYGNVGTVTAGDVSDTDLSHYRNPNTNPGIDVEKLTNGVNADNPADAPQVAEGEDVTWTYLVTNTGDVAFAFGEVGITDDNGTPADPSDDFTPNFVAASDDGDLLLSPGETWQYTYTVAADNLSVVVDFDTDGEGNFLSKGTKITHQYDDYGLTISTNTAYGAMIFDSENPTGGDTDLRTPGFGVNNDTALGNILIISENGSSSNPDDRAAGGTFSFDFAAPVRINSVDILDIDAGEKGGTVKTYDAFGDLIGTHSILDVGNNGFQIVVVGDEGVACMEVTFVGSGAVTELSFDRIYKNVATVAVAGADDSDASHYANPPEEVDSAQASKRFFVVDTYNDKSFEYDSDGTPLESNHLARANYAPRGIALNLVGNRAWVIDQVNGVFVYDEAGNLLGRWDAGGLCEPEGIATDAWGEDIWIVDNRLDRVFFYDGGGTNHTRRIDRQNPTSSFALHHDNNKPSGMTTDGSTIWVVNDGQYANEVFVYNTRGRLQGRWQIDGDNNTPRGITINPGDVNHIWIVDNSADKVFEYHGGAFFTSGRHRADDDFRLASGNRKPEGLADPPPGIAQSLALVIAESLKANSPTVPARHLNLSVKSDAVVADSRAIDASVDLIAQHIASRSAETPREPADSLDELFARLGRKSDPLELVIQVGESLSLSGRQGRG